MAFSERPMRRAALVQTWGIGAIVPFPHDESLMIAGLDAWRYNKPKAFEIKDVRLMKRLGVKALRFPPDYRDNNVDPENAKLKIPAVRFPTWHYCPWCGFMRKASLYEPQPVCQCPQWVNGRKCNPQARFRKKMVPERFIVICRKGHVDDFPVAEWLHHDSEHSYNPESCMIRRSTGGTSAALTGVFYECTCGAKRSLANATTPGALKRIDYHCRGSKPWLGDPGSGCDCDIKEDIRVVLRGATNVWFGDTRSSIRIPVEASDDSRINGLVDEYYDRVSHNIVDGVLSRGPVDMLAELMGVNANDLYAAFVARMNQMEGEAEVSETMSEDDYRLAEYKVLCKSSGRDDQDFHSVSILMKEYDESIRKYFSRITLVPKLKETRAFVGFSRLEPNNASIEEKKSQLKLGKVDWLPAIEVSGEGIFFEFSQEALEEWIKRPAVKDRISTLNSSFLGSWFGRDIDGSLHPEFVMIHTFAHLMINQLSYECGYGSSSIRERIYCERVGNKHRMRGVLIYTASGDSEGSMGGLVRQGKPGRLEDTVLDALRNATWCASDPVCIQSKGQGPESLNLAACHSCALLPETCCECGNRLLDRGVVIGSLTNPEAGYFAEIRDEDQVR